MIFKTQQQLDERLAYWKPILRVQDWEITAQVSRARDMPMEGVQGYIDIVHATKQASIKILNPTDYPPTAFFPQDHEATLVHELLHLHFETVISELEDTDRCYTQKEQAICSIETALIALDRK